VNAQQLSLRAMGPVQTKGVAQKVKRLGRDPSHMGLGFVHRQLQRGHHVPHDAHGLLGPTPAADHEVIRVVDDAGVEPGLTPQRLPSHNEPTHVHVTQQRADWRALWAAASLILVPCRSLHVPPLVDFLDGRFQPHLQQRQHRAVHDAPRQAAHEFGVGNVVEVPAQVGVDHVRVPPVE